MVRPKEIKCAGCGFVFAVAKRGIIPSYCKRDCKPGRKNPVSKKEIVGGKKQCTKCLNFVEKIKFGKHPKTKDGLASWCNQCLSEYNKQKYKENPKLSQSIRKKWYEKAKETLSDTLVKQAASHHFKVPYNSISIDLIETKRAHMKLIKAMKGKQNEANN